MKPHAVACLGVALAAGACVARAADNPYAEAFVSEYRCEGDRALAVAYPVPRLRATAPVRIAWGGATAALAPAGARSGLRWTSRADDLAWTTQGRMATLTRASDGTVLAAGCREQ